MEENTKRRLRYYLKHSADFYAVHVNMVKKPSYNLRQQAEVNRIRKSCGNAFTVVLPALELRKLVKSDLYLFGVGEDGVARWNGTYSLEMLMLAKENGWPILWHGTAWKERAGNKPTGYELDITERLNAMSFNSETYIRTGNVHKKGNGYNPDITGSNGTTIECKGIDGRFSVKELPMEAETEDEED